MDHNGNLSLSERRALRPGDCVVYQTEALAHRGEMAGTVARVGESGIVYIGKHGSRYALLSDFVRRADWMWTANHPQAPAPEADVSASEKREEFLRDIAATRETIAKWPAWKRNALGPVPAAPDFPPVAAPEPARGDAEPETGKDTGEAPNAPEGQGMASGDVTDQETGMVYAPAVAVEALQARVASLTAERDEARNQLRCLAVLARDMIRRVKEVCGE